MDGAGGMSREDLINGAVDFLSNPRIQGTTRDQQDSNYIDC